MPNSYRLVHPLRAWSARRAHSAPMSDSRDPARSRTLGSVRCAQPGDQLRARVDVQLRVDVVEVVPHGLDAEDQAVCDLLVGESLADEPGDDLFLRREGGPGRPI